MKNIINSLVKYLKYFVPGSFILIFSLVFFSCTKDFNINAPWKDITVVYGLLNQNDTIHIIKVNKAFLGNENAYTMAKCSDSLNYTNATVSIEQDLNGVKKTFLLKDTILKKDTGTFASDNNKVYITRATLNPNATFNLVVKIPGKDEITSSTKLINGLVVDNPVDYAGQTISLDTTSNFHVKWRSTPGARLYELTIRFYYYEILNGGLSTLHHQDWVQNKAFSATLDGNEDMAIDIPGSSFFQFLATKIKPVDGMVRVVRKKSLDFIFLAGGDDLSTYIEVSSPSNTVVQEKPFWTNISNGIGLFSSRYDKTIRDKELYITTINLISTSRFTKTLGFKNYSLD